MHVKNLICPLLRRSRGSTTRTKNVKIKKYSLAGYEQVGWLKLILVYEHHNYGKYRQIVYVKLHILDRISMGVYLLVLWICESDSWLSTCGGFYIYDVLIRDKVKRPMCLWEGTWKAPSLLEPFGRWFWLFWMSMYVGSPSFLIFFIWL